MRVPFFETTLNDLTRAADLSIREIMKAEDLASLDAARVYALGKKGIYTEVLNRINKNSNTILPLSESLREQIIQAFEDQCDLIRGRIFLALLEQTK